MTSALTLGVDVGGTKILGLLVDADGTVLAERRLPTPAHDAHAVEDAVVAVVDELRRDAGPVSALGVGAAGLVDGAQGVVLHSAHLPWRDEPLRDRLAERTGLPVTLDNDATTAAWAEQRYGAGEGAADLVFVALGTGIGGAIVSGGRLVRGRHGLAGEFGHVQVVPDGRPCPCGLRGCWERYCSGSALALSTLEEVGHWLAVGLAGLIATFDPEVVVLGGGLGVPDTGLLAMAEARLPDHLTGAAHRPLPRLAYAALGPRAGALGAAGLARQG